MLNSLLLLHHVSEQPLHPLSSFLSHSKTRSNSAEKVKVLATYLSLTLYDPMDCSLPGSSVHGILQARILEWVAISFSRGSSPPRDQTWFSYTAGGTTREALNNNAHKIM